MLLLFLKGPVTSRSSRLILSLFLSSYLNENVVVVLDNASFHSASDIIEIVKEKGTEVIYLPPYSSGFKPTKHECNSVKKKSGKF
ncbi:MAG: transposase [Oligoflexales bacterium]